MRNHGWWMILCCFLPLLVIFLLPILGVRGDSSVLFFVLMMFVCHFMMMGGHQHQNENDPDEGKQGYKKGGQHGRH